MSFRLSALNVFLRLAVRPVLRRTKEPAVARRDLELACKLFLHGPRHSAHPVSLNGIPALRIDPPKVREDSAIFYLHGGGYVAGSACTHRPMMARLAAMTGLSIYLPEYRLAPENPAPAAFDDAVAAWAGVQGYDRLILGGDSAGGGLALALGSKLSTSGDDRLCGTFAFSPWTDLALQGDSLKENANRDVLLPVERIEELVGMVLGDLDVRDPRISPLYGKFKNTPPTYIQVSETEILRDDAIRMEAALREQGVDTKVDTWPDAPHVWQMLDGWIPEAREALGRVAEFIETCLSQKHPTHEN